MLEIRNFHIIFVSVFHRILDFKAGLDFYLGPFFIFRNAPRTISKFTGHLKTRFPSWSDKMMFSDLRKLITVQT
jgi:hypothetical protein